MAETDASLSPGTQESHEKEGQDDMEAKMIRPAKGVVEFDIAGGDVRYNMGNKQRGFFIIINNSEFKESTGHKSRPGSDEDAANLHRQFTKLGFHVQRFDNLTRREMEQVMKEVGEYDHSEHDCFGCAILSHGADNDLIYGTDAPTLLSSLVEPVKGDKCKTLVGKPKLFFIQACRGFKLDEGVDLADAPGGVSQKPQRIPLEADLLYAYSTTPGYYSWRNNERGSWFVQALCHVLNKYGADQEIMTILTLVNRMVAYDFESNASEKFMSEKKQIPSIISQLTKQLYFSPKA